MGAAIFGLFFGLMPPYVFTILIVATWGVPPLEPPTEQSFRFHQTTTARMSGWMRDRVFTCRDDRSMPLRSAPS